MKKLVLFLILLVSVSLVKADIRINEIMYNPEGNDNNKEFVEIFYHSFTNLSDYVIGDGKSNDSLTLLQYFNNSYALIVEEAFNYDNINASVYSVGTTIGNNLGNTEDAVMLFLNNSLIDKVEYSDDKADGNGYSLEYYDNEWYESVELNGTPGKENSVKNHIQQDFSPIEINEFLPDPEGDDNSAMPAGEWIELYNSGNEILDLKGLYFKDSTNHKLSVADTTTLDGTLIDASGYLTIYMNGFTGFLNNEDYEEITLYDLNQYVVDSVSFSTLKSSFERMF